MSRQRPKVGILFPSKDDGYFVGTTLWMLHQEVEKYRAEGGEVDISLLNDGSTDQTTEMLRNAHKSYGWKLQEHPKNTGVTVALKDAFDALDDDTEIILRCDADAIFIQPGWLGQMVDFLLSDERTGVIAPCMILPDATVSSQGIRIFPDGETEINKGVSIFEEAPGRILEVDAVYGAYSMMRRSDWTIDTGYFLWVEDEDQSIVTRQKGKKNFCLGTLKLSHYNHLRPQRVKAQQAKKENPTRKDHWEAGLNHLRIGYRYMKQAMKSDSPSSAVSGQGAGKASPGFDWRVGHPIRRKSVDYFGEKWGFNLLEPDLDVVRQKYRDTELLWWDDPNSQAEGQAIIERYLRSL